LKVLFETIGMFIPGKLQGEYLQRYTAMFQPAPIADAGPAAEDLNASPDMSIDFDETTGDGRAAQKMPAAAVAVNGEVSSSRIQAELATKEAVERVGGARATAVVAAAAVPPPVSTIPQTASVTVTATAAAASQDLEDGDDDDYGERPARNTPASHTDPSLEPTAPVPIPTIAAEMKPICGMKASGSSSRPGDVCLNSVKKGRSWCKKHTCGSVLCSNGKSSKATHCKRCTDADA
jgi:hypothetical protein